MKIVLRINDELRKVENLYYREIYVYYFRMFDEQKREEITKKNQTTVQQEFSLVKFCLHAMNSIVWYILFC